MTLSNGGRTRRWPDKSMENKTGDRNRSVARSIDSGWVTMLVGLAAVTLIVHLLTGGRYGFHRDELATLDDAKHLALGLRCVPAYHTVLCAVISRIFRNVADRFSFLCRFGRCSGRGSCGINYSSTRWRTWRAVADCARCYSLLLGCRNADAICFLRLSLRYVDEVHHGYLHRWRGGCRTAHRSAR